MGHAGVGGSSANEGLNVMCAMSCAFRQTVVRTVVVAVVSRGCLTRRSCACATRERFADCGVLLRIGDVCDARVFVCVDVCLMVRPTVRLSVCVCVWVFTFERSYVVCVVCVVCTRTIAVCD